MCHHDAAIADNATFFLFLFFLQFYFSFPEGRGKVKQSEHSANPRVLPVVDC